MAVGRCDHCGVEEYMPFVCKFCRGRHCASHRLPENHLCQGLEQYRERVRAEGRLVAPEPDLVQPRVSAGARASAWFASAFDRLEGRAAFTFLVAMVAVFVLQTVLRVLGLHGLYDALFVLDSRVLLEPWTVVTSIFAHADFFHFFLNGIIFYFFGPTLERLIGTRRFSWLFIGGGVAAGLIQLLVFNVYLGYESGVLGASGGLLALLGTLTVLAPKLTVLVMFVIPAPLWAVTALYAFFDVLGAFSSASGASSGTAHVAHLGGLVIGLVYGKRLRDRGLRVRPERTNPVSRRHF